MAEVALKTENVKVEIMDIYANTCFTILGLSQASLAEVNQANISFICF